MRQNKLLILLSVGILIGISSCLVPFIPELDKEDEFIVISGHISNIPGKYSVSVSNAIPFDEIGKKPLEGCVVTIEDSKGITKEYTENTEDPGIYEIELDHPFLDLGEAYSIRIITPDDDEYRSKPDTIFPSSEIESIYYTVKSGDEYGVNVPGIQFYIDVKGPEDGARSFRWDLTETWEYHSRLTPDLVYDGDTIIPYNSLKNRICYMTTQIPTVLSATTVSSPQNQLLGHPLIFVSNQSTRLSHKYSILVNQQSLSNASFEYWNHINPIDQGIEELYETQPFDIRGNIYSVSNPEEEVLGFFFATSYTKKRITVDEILPFSTLPMQCGRVNEIQNLNSIYTDELLYLIPGVNNEGQPIHYSMDSRCVDCRLFGGTTEKPEFW